MLARRDGLELSGCWRLAGVQPRRAVLRGGYSGSAARASGRARSARRDDDARTNAPLLAVLGYQRAHDHRPLDLFAGQTKSPKRTAPGIRSRVSNPPGAEARGQNENSGPQASWSGLTPRGDVGRDRQVLPSSLEIRLTGLEQVQLASRSATAMYAALAERRQRAARHGSIPARWFLGAKMDSHAITYPVPKCRARTASLRLARSGPARDRARSRVSGCRHGLPGGCTIPDCA
jgi:hypothetical protein